MKAATRLKMARLVAMVKPAMFDQKVGCVCAETCNIYKQSLIFFGCCFEIHLLTKMTVNKSTFRALVVLELIDLDEEKEKESNRREKKKNKELDQKNKKN